jgi:hypothetical protein
MKPSLQVQIWLPYLSCLHPELGPHSSGFGQGRRVSTYLEDDLLSSSYLSGSGLDEDGGVAVSFKGLHPVLGSPVKFSRHLQEVTCSYVRHSAFLPQRRVMQGLMHFFV